MIKPQITVPLNAAVPEGKRLYKLISMNYPDPPLIGENLYQNRLIEWVFQSNDNPKIEVRIKTSNLLTALNNKQNLPLRILQELHQTHILSGISGFYDINKAYGKTCYLDIRVVPQKNGKTVLSLVIPEKKVDLPYWLKVPILPFF